VKEEQAMQRQRERESNQIDTNISFASPNASTAHKRANSSSFLMLVIVVDFLLFLLFLFAIKHMKHMKHSCSLASLLSFTCLFVEKMKTLYIEYHEH
jgi:hypothetical protein